MPVTVRYICFQRFIKRRFFLFKAYQRKFIFVTADDGR